MISLRPNADEWEKSWRKNNESHPMVNDWRFLGIGICVDDLESASDYYSHLGYSQLSEINDRKEWGVMYQEYSVSKILFELMRAEDSSIYSSSLKQRGEGVAELIFEVSNLKLEIDRLVGRGAEILKISDDNKMASMGSGAKGNILTRLVQKN
jgi:4-hydroxyphenylpyruvate dioxygenase-like putative hemolysin